MQDLSLEKISNPLKGNIKISGSKSLSNRVLIMLAIANISSELHNISNSEDTMLMQKLLQLDADILDCGKAGTTLRFLASYKAFQNRACIITGDERMKQRPIMPLIDALIALGAEIKYLEEIDETLFPQFWSSNPSWQNSISAIKRTKYLHKIVGAFYKNNLIGYLIYTENGRIKQFAVEKEFRHSGIAQTLFAQLNNPEIIITNVDKNDGETISFLEKLGLNLFLEQFEMKFSNT